MRCIQTISSVTLASSPSLFHCRCTCNVWELAPNSFSEMLHVCLPVLESVLRYKYSQMCVVYKLSVLYLWLVQLPCFIAGARVMYGNWLQTAFLKCSTRAFPSWSLYYCVWYKYSQTCVVYKLSVHLYLWLLQLPCFIGNIHV